MIAEIRYGAAHEYEIAPGWRNRLRWAILQRIHPFSRRLWWGDHVTGWPRTRVKRWQAEAR